MKEPINLKGILRFVNLKGILRLVGLKGILGLVGLASTLGCFILGLISSSGGTTNYHRIDRTYEPIPLEVTSGYTGGAIGLGLIASACFISLTWIEVSRYRLNEK
ncbi:MAG: hypothetical protein HWE14_07940 [Flavobacteriia bacterium]|nr:hypothetical protein [Flavobacteriia bacterium]